MDIANTKQLTIFSSVTSSILVGNEYKNVLFSLRGSAGTGKTWLIAQMIKEFKNKKISIQMCTPTHKALKVVKDMIKSIGLSSSDVEISTIHSFLNLKLDYGLDGDLDNINVKPKLVANTNSYNENQRSVDLLILDESSMVNDELFNLILSVVGTRVQYVLFVGDAFQLKPVEGGENSLFDDPRIVHYELTDTVRQKENSIIIHKANEIRDYIKNKTYPNTLQGLFTSGGEIEVIDRVEEFLIKYNENSEDRTKMVGAYTNTVVDQYNAYLRYLKVYQQVTDPEDIPYLLPKEEIVLQSPYSNSNGDIIFQNGEEVNLKTVKLVECSLTGLWYWKCRTGGSFMDQRQINILDPQSYEEYDQKKEILIQKAKAEKDPIKKKDAWKDYFKFANKYANVKYNFASTIHKLQGSTYTDMFFDIRGLERFYKYDPDNVMRLIYVAVTRASDKLYILKDVSF